MACLAEIVGAAPTAVTQHLATRSLTGLVTGRREGTFVDYSAADTHVRALLAEALFHADDAGGGVGHGDAGEQSEPAPPTAEPVRLPRPQTRKPARERAVAP